MSKRDLVDQYVGGQMDRREFIKRMVRLGVSVVAAGTFAQALAPNEAKAQTNEYGFPIHSNAAAVAQSNIVQQNADASGTGIGIGIGGGIGSPGTGTGVGVGGQAVNTAAQVNSAVITQIT